MTVELQQLCTIVIHPKFVRSRIRMNMKKSVQLKCTHCLELD